MATYVHHRISCVPRQWKVVADRLTQRRALLAQEGGALYGLWRSQIGRPRDEVTAITTWSRPVTGGEADAALLRDMVEVEDVDSRSMIPTLRPREAAPPSRQGNYAFRWFVTPEGHWQTFLDLCAQAWPGFEAAYDSQVIGLWRFTGVEPRTGGSGFLPPLGAGIVLSLLLTRRPDLAMWERSKLPEGAAEEAVRDALSRRYDLCDWTCVHTTTLLTAQDAEDRARWT